ncbi:ULK/ULK protein kinase [Spizellomyces punctatus DAOM BR117]|uniref:non-specific serine/threonine protein kinase n=1 Tax=Spizellomyces punctatus (strain DAOM BR117) TaxID=645134 RepID=A0A0L0HS88_SPIPD|nr:ULK/ULK protein kinase [Spizellomyces punctatus DAOM BR117]KND04221.1 ULK/ULK protein kinase [Spizellomyces punctatus DAOM BR117]|eukprot:XP_016612260.1 ULK/ULK protein kinase [Spizellomyces punctatus DAOM BR117]
MSSIPSTVSSTAVGDYIIGHEIGRGSFATVYMGKSISSGQPVAVKSVSRDKLNRKLAENLEGEIKILKGIQHEHVVALLDIMKTDKHIHLIMEYCSLGDLSHYIKRRGLVGGATVEAGAWNPLAGPWGGLNDVVVRHFLKQLASAMEFLRAHSLIHRDLKPQNVLLSPAPQDSPAVRIPNPAKPGTYVTVPPLPMLKLADFGFARALPSQSLASTLCGSPLYMAPEILRGDRYDAKADLWSFGAILYEMVTGRPPFKAQNHIDLLRKIERGEGIILFPGEDMASMVAGRRSNALSSSPSRRLGTSPSSSPRFPHMQGAQPISDDLKDLIRKLLKRNPSERMSFEAFFADPCVISNRAIGGHTVGSFNASEGLLRGTLRRSPSSSSQKGTTSIPSSIALEGDPPFALGPSSTEPLFDVTNRGHIAISEGLGLPRGDAQMPAPLYRVHTSPAKQTTVTHPSSLRQSQTQVLGMAHPNAVPAGRVEADMLASSSQYTAGSGLGHPTDVYDHQSMRHPSPSSAPMRHIQRLDMQRQTSAPVFHVKADEIVYGPHPPTYGYSDNLRLERTGSERGRMKIPGDDSDYRDEVRKEASVGFEGEKVPPFSSVVVEEDVSHARKVDMLDHTRGGVSVAIEPPFPGYANVDPSIFVHATGSVEPVPGSSAQAPGPEEDTRDGNNNSSLSSLGSLELSDADADDVVGEQETVGDPPATLSPPVARRLETSARSGSGSGSGSHGNVRASLEEYVVVEKRVVEVNWLADEVAGAVGKNAQDLGAGESGPVSPISAAAGHAVFLPPARGRSPSTGSSQGVPVPISGLVGSGTSSSASVSSGSPHSPRSLRLEPKTQGRIFGSLRESTHQFLNVSSSNSGGSGSPGGILGTTPPAAYAAAATAGGTGGRTGSPGPNIHSGLEVVQTEGYHPLLDTLNLCALRGHAVQQLGDSLLSSSSVSPTTAEEALGCYLLALRCYQLGIEVAKGVWESRSGGVNLRILSTAVQWVRERFNECLDAAETCRGKIEGSGVEEGRRCVERVVYDRALEVSRTAALNELSSQPSHSQCESMYRHAILLVEALLLMGDDCDVDAEGAMSDEDKRVLERFVASLWGRVGAVSRKAVG